MINPSDKNIVEAKDRLKYNTSNLNEVVNALARKGYNKIEVEAYLKPYARNNKPEPLSEINIFSSSFFKPEQHTQRKAEPTGYTPKRHYKPIRKDRFIGFRVLQKHYDMLQPNISKRITEILNKYCEENQNKQTKKELKQEQGGKKIVFDGFMGHNAAF